MANHMFLVYDERARPGANTDDSFVFVCENTEAKARRCEFRGYVWRYDVDTDGKTLINETFIGPTKRLEREVDK